MMGRVLFSDGDKYDGWWSSGKINGIGTYTYASGDVYSGQWNNDKREGSGKVTQGFRTPVSHMKENGKM